MNSYIQFLKVTYINEASYLLLYDHGRLNFPLALLDHNDIMRLLKEWHDPLKACPNCNGILTLTIGSDHKTVEHVHCDGCGFKGSLHKE